MKHLRHCIALTALAAGIAAGLSCGDVVRQGRSPVFLVLDSLGAARGNATTFSSTLQSDVLTLVTSPAPCTAVAPCPTIFSDSGRGIFHLEQKNINTPVGPTSNNAVTLNRYHVDFRRADGRNTPGVDVPFSFDGAATGTVPPTGTLTLGFEFVRHVAKEESPLVQLISSPVVISTIAQVTFFGEDQVGNDISVSGSMLVDFGNFGDQ